jgi:processing peptidase subunit alpha
MYTRLYTQVLNRNGWIESCNVVNHSHTDNGVFGITAAVPSDQATHHHVAQVVCDQLLLCTTTCRPEELDRAKNQLKSSLLMSLESKSLELEDIGRQVLAYGKRMNVLDMCKRIDLVTSDDVIRVARRVFLKEDKPSRFDFHDGFCNPSIRTGDGSPTILVHGPLTGSKDSLWNVEQTIAKWGLMESDKQNRGRSRRASFFSKF